MQKIGVMVISHGSRDPHWVGLVREACAGITLPAELAGAPVECAFLELVDGHLIQDGIDRLEQTGVTDIIVVPLFLSSGSTHVAEIAWALGLRTEPGVDTELTRFRVSARLHMTGPIDDDPDMARLIAEKLASLSEDPARELVLLIGHGSDEEGFRQRYEQGLASLARQVKATVGFAEADYALLLPDQTAAKLRGWLDRRPELTVLVAPVFLSEGYFTNRIIPGRLAGFPHKYSGQTLLPSPRVSAWISGGISNVWAGMSGSLPE